MDEERLDPTQQPEIPEIIETEETKKQDKAPFDLVGTLLEYAEILAFSLAAVLVVFTLLVRLCRVDGSSMRNTLYDGQMLVTTSLGEVQQGDVIVFHMTGDGPLNEALVKRVIATGGQTVRMDCRDGSVWVDGELLAEPYVSYLDGNGNTIGYLSQFPAYGLDRTTGIFETTVPEGCLFVMGDNRNHSADSRTAAVSFVDERRVLGRVLLRVSPLTTDLSGEE